MLPATLLAVASAACNETSQQKAEVSDFTNTLVTSFHLKADSKVMANLDSVFFSIDLENCLIFNADSLPKGTDVSKVIPIVTCASGVSGVVFDMQGGSVRTGTSDYIRNPSDSIDFTGRVSLRVTAADGTTSSTYEIKVNVHRTDPDSLSWGNSAVGCLPSRLGSPKAQKTIDCDGLPVTLLRESDDTYTLARGLQSGEWSKTAVTPGFTPDIRSLEYAGSAFYILDTDGRLMASADAQSWTDTGRRWTTLTGSYGSHVLGLEADGAGHRYAAYPDIEGFNTDAAPATFPVSGTSRLISITNKWMQTPIAILVGGRAADGSLSNATWGFDGSTWANLTETPPPAIDEPVIIPYFMYKRAGALWIYDRYSVLLLMGGRTADGALNRTVYISYDTGLTWEKAPQSLALPDGIPSFRSADCVIATHTMTADFKPVLTPLSDDFQTDGYTVTWRCPYIYLFGGIGAESRLLDSIYRGVINRLTYRPIF